MTAQSALRPRSTQTSEANFHVEIGRPRADTVVLQLYGEIDLTTLPLLDSVLEHVLGGWPQRLIIGLSHVDFLCAKGLGTLYAAHQGAVEHDTRFALTEPTTMIRRILSITCVDQTVPVYTHLDDALAD